MGMLAAYVLQVLGAWFRSPWPFAMATAGLLGLAALSEGTGLVFPGVRDGRPLSENTHAKLLRELGFDAVTHGFRSSFRDYAAEQTHTPHAVMEAALAHTIKDQGRGCVRPERPVREASGINGVMVAVSGSLTGRPLRLGLLSNKGRCSADRGCAGCVARVNGLVACSYGALLVSRSARDVRLGIGWGR